MSDALREVIEAAMRHRLRALATAFGVFWGIFMLTLLLGGGAGLRNGVYAIFEGTRNLVWIEAGRTGHPYQGLGAGRRIDLTLQDVHAITRAIPELTSVSPRQSLPSYLTIQHENKSLGLPVMGVYETFGEAIGMRAVRGRLLNHLDVERARKVVVLGTQARTLLFGESNPVGAVVTIAGIRLTVVGEFHDPGDEDHNRRVFLPYSTLQKSFDSAPRIQSIVANTREGASEPFVRKRLTYLLARRHRFDPEDVAAVEVWFASEEFKRLTKVMRGIDLAIIVVGLGTLLSGMVGVSNILFVSVRERAQEFGIRRALGATARNILTMVIAEALLLASISGGLGLLSALGLIHFVADVNADYFKHPQVNLSAALWALGTLVVTALVAGYFPAREAARMTPIEALRRE